MYALLTGFVVFPLGVLVGRAWLALEIKAALRRRARVERTRISLARIVR